MTFDPNCLDCPTPVAQLLHSLGIGIALLTLGAVLVQSRSKQWRYVGSIPLAIAVFWYLVISMGVAEHGVLWSSASMTLSRAANAATLAAWYAFSAAVVSSALRLSRARA